MTSRESIAVWLQQEGRSRSKAIHEVRDLVRFDDVSSDSESESDLLRPSQSAIHPRLYRGARPSNAKLQQYIRLLRKRISAMEKDQRKIQKHRAAKERRLREAHKKYASWHEPALLAAATAYRQNYILLLDTQLELSRHRSLVFLQFESNIESSLLGETPLLPELCSSPLPDPMLLELDAGYRDLESRCEVMKTTVQELRRAFHEAKAAASNSVRDTRESLIQLCSDLPSTAFHNSPYFCPKATQPAFNAILCDTRTPQGAAIQRFIQEGPYTVDAVLALCSDVLRKIVQRYRLDVRGENTAMLPTLALGVERSVFQTIPPLVWDAIGSDHVKMETRRFLAQCLLERSFSSFGIDDEIRTLFTPEQQTMTTSHPQGTDTRPFSASIALCSELQHCHAPRDILHTLACIADSAVNTIAPIAVSADSLAPVLAWIIHAAATPSLPAALHRLVSFFPQALQFGLEAFFAVQIGEIVRCVSADGCGNNR